MSSQSCNDTTTVTVNVNTAPQVSFTSTPTSGCVPFTATFTNTTTNAANYLWNFGDGTTSTDAAPIHDYLTAGTFTVTLLATVGSCADSDSVVGMITTFTPPIFDLGPDISTNSVTYLLDAGAGFSSYQWSNGSTTQSIIADTNGVYCAIVTDNNTCSDSDCVQIILDALSAGNISDENDFTIYPNPADESAVISWQSANGKSVELNVFESTGRLITKQDLFATCTLPIASWQAGVYFVEIQAGDKTIRKKLIVHPGTRGAFRERPAKVAETGR